MAKVSQLSDDQLKKMITKHRKILDKLLNEKNKRGHKTDISTESMDDRNEPPKYMFDLESEHIDQNAIEESVAADKQSTTQFRVTQLLKLTPKQLEELNREARKKRIEKGTSTTITANIPSKKTKKVKKKKKTAD
ncbi:MAG: hypothetical protein KAQ98_06470 [Bacteriovoracaceae bacterium]|nr:hypothetical protein [Bacteriovoracaceae bacterium]